MRHWPRAVDRWLAHHHQSSVAHKVATFGELLVRGFENDDANGRTNGEHRVLRSLSSQDVVTVFDVGAHHGSWTAHALEVFPRASVHAFEIDPVMREILTSRVGALGPVTVPPFGLADQRGEVDVYVDDLRPSRTSMVAPSDHHQNVRRCTVERGDDYLAGAAIDHVDLIKIDAEGADLAVIRGFQGALSEGRIGLIQFEFTRWAPIARTWLADFYELLAPAGFTLGKVFPTFVDWRGYEPEHEIFSVRANFLAVHESRADLRRAIDR